MIRVRRSAVATPPVLAGPCSAGQRESAVAEAFFEVAANRSKRFDFKVYKKKEVKRALAALFGGKCAYCESLYDPVQPPDVEHFRPKAVVAHFGVLRKPGYYWLAAEWSNLLPSCIDCNRQRRHPEVDDDADPTISGKANWFPLANEDLRAQFPGEEAREIRLLIDPCRDRPESHLIFHADGLIEAASPKGAESIGVYGLNRPGLVRGRQAVRERLVHQIDHTSAALSAAKAEPTAARRRTLADELQELLGFADNSRPYAGMVRQITDPYVELMAEKLRAYFAADVPAGEAARSTVDAFLDRHATIAPAKPAATADLLKRLEAI